MTNQKPQQERTRSDSYTQDQVDVEILCERTKLLNEVREIVEGMKDKKYGWSTYETIKESYTEINNQVLDDLLSAINKLEGE